MDASPVAPLNQQDPSSPNCSTSSVKVPIKLHTLNPNITCVLCTGYLISAVTIVECLHSFCRRCILNFLRENPTTQACPICDTLLHKTKPLLSLRPDKTLQDIVYKLVPGLYSRELNQRKQFCYSTGMDPEDDEMLAEHENGSVHFYAPDEKISLSLEYALPGGVTREMSQEDGDRAITSMGESAYDDGESCQRRYLLCPASLAVVHLKKFIFTKYRLSDKCYTVEVMYQDEVLEGSLKLMDIAYIFSWRRSNPMRFFYRIGKNRIVPSVRLALPKEKNDDPVRLAKVSPRVQLPASDTTQKDTSDDSTHNSSTAASQSETLGPTDDTLVKNEQVATIKETIVSSPVAQPNPEAAGNNLKEDNSQQIKTKSAIEIKVQVSNSSLQLKKNGPNNPTPVTLIQQPTQDLVQNQRGPLVSKPAPGPTQKTKESISVQCNIKSSPFSSGAAAAAVAASSSTTSVLRGVRITSNHRTQHLPQPITGPNHENSSAYTIPREVQSVVSSNSAAKSTELQVPSSKSMEVSCDTNDLKRKIVATGQIASISESASKKIATTKSVPLTSDVSTTKFHMRNILGGSSPPPSTAHNHQNAAAKIKSVSQSTSVSSASNVAGEKLTVVPTPKGVTIVRESSLTKKSIAIGPSVPMKSLTKTNKISTPATCTPPMVPSGSTVHPKVINTPLKPSSASLQAFRHYFNPKSSMTGPTTTADKMACEKAMSATEKVKQYLDTQVVDPAAAGPMIGIEKNKFSQQSPPLTSKVGTCSSGPKNSDRIDRIVAKIMTKNVSPVEASAPSGTTSNKGGPASPNKSTFANALSPKSSDVTSMSCDAQQPVRSPPYASPTHSLPSPSRPTSGNLVIRISTKGSEMMCTTTSPGLRSPTGSASGSSPGHNNAKSPEGGSEGTVGPVKLASPKPFCISSPKHAPLSSPKAASSLSSPKHGPISSPKPVAASLTSPTRESVPSPKPSLMPAANESQPTGTTQVPEVVVPDEGGEREKEENQSQDGASDEEEGQLVVDIADESESESASQPATIGTEDSQERSSPGGN